jgi:hypothetical protein
MPDNRSCRARAGKPENDGVWLHSPRKRGDDGLGLDSGYSPEMEIMSGRSRFEFITRSMWAWNKINHDL